MGNTLRIGLSQTNFRVGDLANNTRQICAHIGLARESAVDLLLFPELSLTGYPPEDLLLKPSFIDNVRNELENIASHAQNIVAIVGAPIRGSRSSGEPTLHNGAAVLANGRVSNLYHKHRLPNYAVFDEQRYFTAGQKALILELNSARLGLTICEDIWLPGGPAEWAAGEGNAEVILNLSASPYHRSKGEERERLFAQRSTENRCFLFFCNTVGGQDELVFDGHSLVFGPDGALIVRGHQFKEQLLFVDIDPTQATSLRSRDPHWPSPSYVREPQESSLSTTDRISCVSITSPRSSNRPKLTKQPLVRLASPEEEIYEALCLGTADYYRKNCFRGAVLGLSGGIDSALTLAIAVDAIGQENVTAVSMPSKFTASVNQDDASILANGLGVALLELPIEHLAVEYNKLLSDSFANTLPNVTEENLQARIRGNLLMALSNKFGWLVLTTGNKSEMSVGYATLYGDMAGGFAVLKDVLKTSVYRLAKWRNRESEVIPQRILDKPPTAELRDNQLDSDTLPPYELLDQILESYIEEDRSPKELEALGFDREIVEKIMQLVDRAEYKRRQAPPGVRISTRAFGKDRRLPITNNYIAGFNTSDE